MGRAFKYVILGGGTSAGYAAQEFVSHGVSHGELCIISEEQVAPYERPALSKGYLLPEGAARLPAFHTCVATGEKPQTLKWYQDHGIELLLNTRVVSADVGQRKLTTVAGETISYDTLLIATGARVLRLEEFGVKGANSSRVCYLRDISDADHLVKTMQACKGGKAVVIGGGYIGMEATAALVANGISVTMVFPESHCMARLFTPEISKFYEKVYEEKGVKFVKGTVMVAIEQNAAGEVTGIVLKNGTRISADMVVVGIGIRANTSLFEGQLLISKGGIHVEGKMKTSNSHVYAIGDVAAFPVKIFNDIRRLEHVDHARKSAATAVSAILRPNRASDYDYLPYYYSRVFNLSWQFYGDNVGSCLHFGNQEIGKFGAYWVENGKLVGAFLEGGSKAEYAAIAAVVRAQPLVPDEKLFDLGIPFVLQEAEKLRSCEDKGHVKTYIPTSREKPSGGLDSKQTVSPLAFQAASGVMIALTIAGLAFWHGRYWKGKR